MEATRTNPKAVADFGVDAIAEHFALIMSKFATQPIVIGHSFGGLLAERLLGDGHAAAAVAIELRPSRGYCHFHCPRCESRSWLCEIPETSTPQSR